ncbi:MAG TPA: T9SS type A sorting domain-containing protein, partial [Saprospiraceae bacterium]|nr:T9SS type A sorting domain-containing protein [Saprospiraceae bacterium]
KTSKISVEDQVSIYPNPSYGEFTISLQGQDKINSVEIYDIAGQLIKSYIHQDSKQVSIILEGLRNGIYFTKITTDTNQLTKKFVIAK